jgi:hypothetical protein
MNTLRAGFLTGLAVFACLLAFQPKATANPGFAEEDEPIEVGKAGAFANGEPKDPKEIKAKTAAGAAAGDVSLGLKNTSGRDVTDVHVKIVLPKDHKIKEINTTHTDFTENDPDGSGAAKSEAVAKVPSQSQGKLENDEEITVDVTIVDSEGNEVENKDVTLEVWWTRGNSRNIVVSATSPEAIGDGDPRVTLASLNTTHEWEFNFGVAQVAAEPEVELNDLAIAECDGFRFQKGSLVVRPNNSTRFSTDFDSFRLSAYTETGDTVLGTGRFSAGEPRVDSRGNFVIDITRSQDDEEHIVIVLSGLKLEGLSGHDSGQKVHADVSGAAVAGHCMHRYWRLLTVVE